MKQISFKVLCQNLADSERFLRTAGTGKVGGIIRGRGEQLDVMKEYYPAAFKRYARELDDRLSKPYEFDSVMNSIKSDDWALHCEMLDYMIEQADKIR